MQKKWADALFIALILILGYLQVKNFYNAEGMPVLDTFSGYTPRAQILKNAIESFGDYGPSWQPYMMSGTPCAVATCQPFLTYIGILSLFFDAFTAVGLSYIISYLLIGVSMYFLGRYIFKDQRIAFLAGIVAMLSGYAISRFGEGVFQLSGYSIMPLAFLFLMKAFNEKEWIRNAVITGVLVAVEIKVSPDMKIALFMSLLFGVYLLFQLIGKEFTSRLKKVISVGLILGLVSVGLTAHYILPLNAGIEGSSRANLRFEESSARKVEFGRLLSVMIEPFDGNSFKIRHSEPDSPGNLFKLGIVSSLLAVFAIYKKPKNKFILFLLSIVILTISIATASFVFYFLWKYVPPWNSFRYVNRAFVLWSFAGSLLAGFGAKYLLGTLKDKFGWNDRKANIAFWAIIILIILNLMVFIKDPFPLARCDLNKLLEKADALQYIKAEKERTGEQFRVHDLETTGIDWPTDPYTIALDQEHIFGYLTGWQSEYMNGYLSVAFRDPARFWGILNVKYVTSRSPVDVPGLKLAKEFPRFESDGKCPPPNQSTWNDPNADATMKAFGQYLYENERMMPRAYTTHHAVLILGDHGNVMNFMYAMMLSPSFDPRTTLLVHGKGGVNDYTVQELDKYTAIVLTPNSADQNSLGKLQGFKSKGGSVLPDIVTGRNDMTQEEVDAFLRNFSNDMTAIADSSIRTINFEKKEIPVERGFLVLSETYSLYDGWRAKLNGKPVEILRVNGVVTGIYIDEPGLLRLEFTPKYYKGGMIISIITLILVMIYFAADFILKKKASA